MSSLIAKEINVLINQNQIDISRVYCTDVPKPNIKSHTSSVCILLIYLKLLCSIASLVCFAIIYQNLLSNLAALIFKLDCVPCFLDKNLLSSLISVVGNFQLLFISPATVQLGPILAAAVTATIMCAVTGGVFMWRSVCCHWWYVHVEVSLLSLVVCSCGGQLVIIGGVFMWSSVGYHWWCVYVEVSLLLMVAFHNTCAVVFDFRVWCFLINLQLETFITIYTFFVNLIATLDICPVILSTFFTL